MILLSDQLATQRSDARRPTLSLQTCAASSQLSRPGDNHDLVIVGDSDRRTPSGDVISPYKWAPQPRGTYPERAVRRLGEWSRAEALLRRASQKVWNEA